MVKKTPAGQVNKRNTQTIKQIKQLMNDLGQKYSIKVGILQAKGGSNIVPGTDLSMADLGAVHEFGANINHPGGQPYYINSTTGLAVFVSKNSLFGQYLISKKQVTKPHKINIPARPFLRPLIDKKGKEYILDYADLADDPELNKLLGEDELEQDTQFMDRISNKIAVAAVDLVKQAFLAGGYPNKWKDITKSSRKQRKYNHTSPPLTDNGDLYKTAINYEVTKGQ